MNEWESESPRVEGCICPGCAHVDGIVEETTVRPLDTSDVIGAAAFGWMGALIALSGRTKKNLRCTRCGCKFGRAPGILTKMGWWVAITAVIMGIAGFLAAAFQPASSSGTLPVVTNVCSALASNPMVAVAMLGTLAIIVLFTVFTVHTNASAERRHLYNALLKRDQGIVFYDKSDSAA